MNAELSEKGIAQVHSLLLQCQNMHKTVRDIKVDAVIVSPYTRAMQTCQILFEGYSGPIIVEPLLSEIFRYSCDVVKPV